MFAHRSSSFNISQALPLVLLTAVTWLTGGCKTPQHVVDPPCSFVFGEDTLAYPNELVWVYTFNPETGKMSHKRRDPPATYTHRCFVLARVVLQFYQTARFAPDQPALRQEEYRKRVRQVMKSSPRRTRAESDRVIIPGYANLHEFSQAQAALLKAEGGGAWESYFQRGHWRMLFPLTSKHQERMATQLRESAGPAAVHLVRFPSLTINHAAVVFGCEETAEELRFALYDPNYPASPTTLTYDRASRTFRLPQNGYFSGGRVDVYQVYHRWNY